MTKKIVDNYPVWTCFKCAMENGGIVRENQISTVHHDICDVCCEWTEVTEPRDFGYPKFKRSNDYMKIYFSLSLAYFKYLDQAQYEYASHIYEHLSIIIPKLREQAKELKDGRTTAIIPRNTDRETTERSDESPGAIGACPQKPIC